ncbi:MAG TPA: acyloxyacyl hydrolase [Desulfuromonas sp.]|nr:acyloxyacyl hydrolase [Desulfuromonas sp.]
MNCTMDGPMKQLCVLLLFALILVGLIPAAPAAAESAWSQPERVGFALYGGGSYNPVAGPNYVLLSGMLLYDYDAIWFHRAPDPLRFKVEANLGVAESESSTRLVAAAGAMALIYGEGLATSSFRPYAEAGIGLIYTDFQVYGQGFRLNFNPRFGFGCDFGHNGRPWYAAVHAHHVSNSGLDEENRGINAVMLQLGRTF